MSWRTVWAEWSRFSPAEIKIWATHQWFLFGYTPNNDICNLTIYNFEMYLFIYFLHTAQYTKLSRGNSSALYAYTHTLIFFGPIRPDLKSCMSVTPELYHWEVFGPIKRGVDKICPKELRLVALLSQSQNASHLLVLSW